MNSQMKWFECRYCLNRFEKKDLFIVKVKSKVQINPFFVCVCKDCLVILEENKTIVKEPV